MKFARFYRHLKSNLHENGANKPSLKRTAGGKEPTEKFPFGLTVGGLEGRHKGTDYENVEQRLKIEVFIT